MNDQECLESIGASCVGVNLLRESATGERKTGVTKVGQHVQSDAELVDAVLAGDRTCFGPLVQRHERGVMAAALVILRDYHAAQDVLQETLLEAFQRLGTLRDGARFGSWVITIARNKARRRWRQRPKQQDARVPLDFVVGGNSQSDELLPALFDAVSELPQRQQQLVLLRYFDGLNMREIAETTGHPIGTVTKDLSRAHGRLRKMLAERDGS